MFLGKCHVSSDCNRFAICKDCSCTCSDGYTGDGVNCFDIDECLLGLAAAPLWQVVQITAEALLVTAIPDLLATDIFVLILTSVPAQHFTSVQATRRVRTRKEALCVLVIQGIVVTE